MEPCFPRPCFLFPEEEEGKEGEEDEEEEEEELQSVFLGSEMFHSCSAEPLVHTQGRSSESGLKKRITDSIFMDKHLRLRGRCFSFDANGSRDVCRASRAHAL